MDIFSILTMIGGLALFLYGMHVMGEGLSKASSGRMERILETLTSNPLKAVLLGAAVTAVIQSSSATTVMVVGFVNSGIMKLSQAIGIIMGANIGTTVTSWLLSLAGLEGSSFFIRLLKPTSFSPILAIIGIALIMFAKNEKKKDIGTVLIGFAVLMFGMDTMSGAVKPLADVPEFTQILTMFSNPILGMLAGAILTAVIQSSSASVGILQALCVTGSVTFSSALPIIMGQNIGTCITALISSVGANKNAKRAATVHLYFNIIGTIVFMVVAYTVNGIFKLPFWEQATTPADIAIVHSIFNVSATFVLLPFSKVLEKLAYLTIRDTEQQVEDTSVHKLDVRFLDSPGLATSQCKEVTDEMAHAAKKALFYALDLIEKYDEDKAKKIEELETIVDEYEDELGSYMVKLSGKSLSEKDNQTVSLMLHNIGDFERISDHALNIKNACQEMYEKQLSFSDKAKEELAVFSKAVRDIMDASVKSFEDNDSDIAIHVEPLEEVIDSLNTEVKKRHIKRLKKGKCTIELGFILSDITTSFERISDHCSNIAVSVLQIKDDSFETHGYLNTLKAKDNIAFNVEYEMVKAKYELP
ncbi:MAG: Na/Pi cotransporter family protein [Lachnospiraceae bacterium]|nr:Na/Pi cotransporter family protein [Lachnospiraceae bacterium]